MLIFEAIIEKSYQKIKNDVRGRRRGPMEIHQQHNKRDWMDRAKREIAIDVKNADDTWSLSSTLDEKPFSPVM